MDFAFGQTVRSNDDPHVVRMEEMARIVSDLGNNQLLNFFTSLKHLPAWFPGAGFIRLAHSAIPLMEELRDIPFQEVQRQMAAGTAKPRFVSLHLEELERQGGATEKDIYELKMAAFQMYGAAAETTWSFIICFIAAMLSHPEVQEKAHTELNTLLGDRLPDFADRVSLPYVESILYEVARRYPTVPLGVPHQTTADDTYRGMFIPKGSMVIANGTAMSQDERVYKDPYLFRPERFLQPNPEQLPTAFLFGFGRRVCPGRFLADAGVWIVVANILAAFEIVPAKDERGNDVKPDIQFTTGLTCHPEPFPCSFRPRSPRMVDLVEQA